MVTNQIYKLRFTEVVVMEDDSETRHLIHRVFKEMGFTEVIFVDSTDAVVELAVAGKLQNFILDIHMGDKRPQEGLDALEILKDIDSDIFVAILSGHPSVDRRRAERLKVNIFQSKSSNLELDIKLIVNVMLHHLQSKLENIMQMELQAIAPYISPVSTAKVDKKIISIRSDELISRLRIIKPGQKGASEYQREMLYII